MSRRLLNPASALLAGYADLSGAAAALLLHSDDPALARWLADALPGGRVIALHSSFRAVEMLCRVPGLEVSEAVYPDPAAHGPADVALLVSAKGRDHVRAALWTAAHALRPGGRLYVAGANAGGAKSAIKDAAALCGDAPVLGFKSSHRIACAVRPQTLCLPPDWDDPAAPHTRTLARPEGEYQIVTMPGVFSWDHLDDGTALLLDHLRVEPGAAVLDVGCGYGIIGLAAARAGARRVVLVDDDLLAVRCARASVDVNGLGDRCTVLPSDLTGAVRDRQFDLVVSNPPFHQGIDVTTSTAGRLIYAARDVLRPGGRIVIVANRFLPYDRTLREVFGNVTTLAETGRYYVLESGC